MLEQASNIVWGRSVLEYLDEIVGKEVRVSVMVYKVEEESVVDSYNLINRILLPHPHWQPYALTGRCN